MSRATGTVTVKSRGGDALTRDLHGWGTSELLIDKEKDRYAERIVLWDGTEITSTAAESDHK